MKLWTSDLDSYKLLISTNERDAWMNDERFWDNLRTRSPSTPAQQAGSAWHHYLEHHTLDHGEGIISSSFDFEDQQYIFESRKRGVIVGAKEHERRFELMIGGHKVTGRVDGLTDHACIDYKTSLKSLPGFSDFYEFVAVEGVPYRTGKAGVLVQHLPPEVATGSASRDTVLRRTR